MSNHWGTPAHQPEPSQPEVLSNRGLDAPVPATYAGPVSTTDLGAGTILAAAPPPARRAGTGKLLAIGAGVLAVAGIGVGAAVAAGALGGGGAQPATRVPASAVAYASVDLDPSLGQKVDALRFLRKFPSVRASLGSTDDIRRWFFDQATKGDATLSRLSYDRDVKPWIGDRFAVAAVPSASRGLPAAVVVLQVSDEGKAKAGLAKLLGKPGDGTCSVSDGYAVCAKTRAVLTAVRADAAKHSLADDPSFKADVSSVGSRGIALVWGDMGKLSRIVPQAAGAVDAPLGGLSGVSSAGASGRVVAALRFTGDSVELTGTTRGASSTVAPGPAGTGVEHLPAKTVVAFGASLDEHAIDRAYATARKQMGAAGNGYDLLGALEAQLAQLGIRLPGDLDKVFGTTFQVAFGGFGADGSPKVGLHSNAAAAPAGAVLDKVSDQLSKYGAPFRLHHVPASGGYAVALDPAYAKELAAGGNLGSQPAFRKAVPDAAAAQAVVYVDLQALVRQLSSLGTAGDDANLKVLQALGASVRTSSDGTATFHVRLTTG